MSLQVGDKVYTFYYGVRHVATVVEVKGGKARLRFRNESGWEIEHTRNLAGLLRVKKGKGDRL